MASIRKIRRAHSAAQKRAFAGRRLMSAAARYYIEYRVRSLVKGLERCARVVQRHWERFYAEPQEA